MLDKKRTKDEKGASTSVRRIYLRVLPAAKSVRTSENLRNCREATMRYLCRLWAFFHKDFYIRKIKRHYIYTSFEVIVPVTLLSVLVYLRYRSTHGSHPEWMGPTCYPESHPLSVITLTANDTVAYAPDNGYTQSLMNYLAKRSTSGTFYSKGYHSWAGLNKDLHGKKVLLALNLEHVNQSSLDYVISIDAPDQFSLKRYPQDNAPRNVSDTIEPYIVFPIIWNVFAHFVNYYHGSVLETPHVQLQPTGRYLKDVSFDQLTRFMSQFLLFSYIVFIGVFPRQIIQEKASRLRVVMLRTGPPTVVNIKC